ncbi:hypothetical protein L3Q82_008543 [Scortum barcoo]|uniref:Uncharacterized protein n=1 Tax=Scortum barcoo TaxID=214431 RepID=A0ACB8XBH7_9TELE|nr:hypothetical protein L3Q82_008543 [Scortum barcoo]
MWRPLMPLTMTSFSPSFKLFWSRTISGFTRGMSAKTTSRDLRYSGGSHPPPSTMPLRSLRTTSVTSAWVMDESTSESPASASSLEGKSVGLRRSSNIQQK